MDLKALSPVSFENLYHLAVVVEDFEQALEETAAELGVSFGPPIALTLRVQTPAMAPATVNVTIAYSKNGPPYLELIQGTEAAGVWSTGSGPRLHHVGIWTEDLAGEAARLERLGMRREAWSVRADGELATFAYMIDAHGLRIELVDAASRAGLESRLRLTDAPG